MFKKKVKLIKENAMERREYQKFGVNYENNSKYGAKRVNPPTPCGLKLQFRLVWNSLSKQRRIRAESSEKKKAMIVCLAVVGHQVRRRSPINFVSAYDSILYIYIFRLM